MRVELPIYQRLSDLDVVGSLIIPIDEKENVVTFISPLPYNKEDLANGEFFKDVFFNVGEMVEESHDSNFFEIEVGAFENSIVYCSATEKTPAQNDLKKDIAFNYYDVTTDTRLVEVYYDVKLENGSLDLDNMLIYVNKVFTLQNDGEEVTEESEILNIKKAIAFNYEKEIKSIITGLNTVSALGDN